MKVKEINVNVFNWNLWFIDKLKKTDCNNVIELIKKHVNISLEDIEYLEDWFKEWGDSQGLHYCYTYRRCSFVIIGRQSSRKEKINTITHEIRHATNRILLSSSNITDEETGAYLTGYLSGEIL